MKASAVLHLCFGRGDDTVGNPHRAQISQIELFEFKLFQFESFELILLLKQGGVAGEGAGRGQGGEERFGQGPTFKLNLQSGEGDH